MSEQNPADDDISVFGLVKAATEAIAKGVGTAEHEAGVIGTVIGAWATVVRAALRS